MTNRNVPILRMHPPTPRPNVKGGTRSEPYILRGRDEEFTHIAAAIPDTDVPMYVLEGPPGTGKTALAQTVGAYAGLCGYTVLTLDAHKFENIEKLSLEIWSQFDHRGRPMPEPEESEVEVNLGLIRIRKQLQSLEYETSPDLVTNLARCYLWEDHKARRQTKGFVLIIDNAAAWRGVNDLPVDNSYRREVKSLCNTLNDVLRHAFPSIPILTIFAGTPGTGHIIQQLTSDRLEGTRYFLRGVSGIAIQQILTDHLRLQYAADDILLCPTVITSEALQQAVQACHNNVWHATCIGRHLQEMYLRHQERGTQPNPQTITDTIREAQLTVYNDMHDRLSQPQARVLSYLALAAEHRDNRLETESAEELLEKANAILKTDIPMELYIQKGIVEERLRTNPYSHRVLQEPREPHYRITIPSYATFLQREIKDKKDIRAKTVHEHLQTMPTVPPWQWRPEDRLQKIDPIGKIDYEPGYAPGHARLLHPTIPGDDPNEPL